MAASKSYSAVLEDIKNHWCPVKITHPHVVPTAL